MLPRDDLLSQDPAVQVPSALESLTSVFGMGTGVTFSAIITRHDWVEQTSMRSKNLDKPSPIGTVR